MYQTEAIIKFNFERALQQAAQLEDAASKLSKLASNDFATTMQGISYNWSGENAEAYKGKGAQLQGKMSTSASNLYSVASDIRQVAKNMYETEMKNLELAQSRNY